MQITKKHLKLFAVVSWLITATGLGLMIVGFVEGMPELMTYGILAFACSFGIAVQLTGRYRRAK